MKIKINLCKLYVILLLNLASTDWYTGQKKIHLLSVHTSLGFRTDSGISNMATEKNKTKLIIIQIKLKKVTELVRIMKKHLADFKLISEKKQIAKGNDYLDEMKE